MNERKSIVVTGATSFLGSALVRKLLDQGHFVYAVIRPESSNRKALPDEKEGLKIISCDLENIERLPEQIKEPCSFFFHFGWDGSGSENRKKRMCSRKTPKIL